MSLRVAGGAERGAWLGLPGARVTAAGARLLHLHELEECNGRAPGLPGRELVLAASAVARHARTPVPWELVFAPRCAPRHPAPPIDLRSRSLLVASLLHPWGPCLGAEKMAGRRLLLGGDFLSPPPPPPEPVLEQWRYSHESDRQWALRRSFICRPAPAQLSRCCPRPAPRALRCLDQPRFPGLQVQTTLDGKNSPNG